MDFVYGTGLYMSPSSMELQIDTIQDYNNKIVIANDTQDLGLNNGNKEAPIPPKHTQPVKGTQTKQSLPEPEPVSKLEYRKQVEEYAKSHNLPQSWVVGISADPSGLKRWLAARAQAKKIHLNKKINAGQDGKKNIQINHKHCQMNTPAVNNTKTIKLH